MLHVCTLRSMGYDFLSVYNSPNYKHLTELLQHTFQIKHVVRVGGECVKCDFNMAIGKQNI